MVHFYDPSVSEVCGGRDCWGLRNPPGPLSLHSRQGPPFLLILRMLYADGIVTAAVEWITRLYSWPHCNSLAFVLLLGTEMFCNYASLFPCHVHSPSKNRRLCVWHNYTLSANGRNFRKSDTEENFYLSNCFNRNLRSGDSRLWKWHLLYSLQNVWSTKILI